MNSYNKRNLNKESKANKENSFESMNFNKLNKEIETTIKTALDQVKDSSMVKINSKIENVRTQDKIDLIKKNKKELDLKRRNKTVPVGRISGVLYTVFGSITSFGFGIAILTLIILGSTLGSLFYKVALGLSPLFLLSLSLLMTGNSNRKRLKRFQRYMSIIRGQSYYLIDDLANATRLSKKFIVRDLEKMIEIGMFPEGHIDAEKTYFILNNKTYKQYLELQKNIKKIRAENKVEEVYELKDEKGKIKLSPEIRNTIDEGRRLVSEIRQSNEEITEVEISNKLARLEKVTERIFDHVEEHPEKFDEISKFTDYFLPTTMKLLDAYKKLDYQPVQGENISKSKKEIEETIDTINIAFENLLDDLFQDMAMDISTDISVLETMLAQEGLTKDELRNNNKHEEEK